MGKINDCFDCPFRDDCEMFITYRRQVQQEVIVDTSYVDYQVANYPDLQ